MGIENQLGICCHTLLAASFSSASFCCLRHMSWNFLGAHSAQAFFAMVHWAKMPSIAFAGSVCNVVYWFTCSTISLPLKFLAVSVARLRFSIISWIMLALHISLNCTLKITCVLKPMTCILDFTMDEYVLLFFKNHTFKLTFCELFLSFEARCHRYNIWIAQKQLNHPLLWLQVQINLIKCYLTNTQLSFLFLHMLKQKTLNSKVCVCLVYALTRPAG